MLAKKSVPAELLVLLPLLAATWLQAGDGAPVLYELDGVSTFSRGCFPPCRCALFSTPGLSGTFVLRCLEATPISTVYEVSDVHWSVPDFNSGPTPVTGSGRYTIGGEVALMHRLELDLIVGEVDEEDLEHFDSGVLAGGGEFPHLNIAVSMNAMVCFDTVLEIVARPAARQEIFVRGDCNADAGYDLSDPVRLLLALFAGAEAPPCRDACDANDDGSLDLTDAIYALLHLFQGGDPPPAPHPRCGVDPEADGPDGLDCASIGGACG